MPFFETTIGRWTVMSLELYVSNFGFSLVASLVGWVSRQFMQNTEC